MHDNFPPQAIRLHLLNRAIEGSPDAAVNFVLRGEYWLEQEDAQQAIADFQTAIELAETELETSDWGYIQQTLFDRSQQGLRLAYSFVDQGERSNY
jgi:hypothetical protein